MKLILLLHIVGCNTGPKEVLKEKSKDAIIFALFNSNIIWTYGFSVSLCGKWM
jgi:hypothetical protein